mmetsp:Transcript_62583/g.167130  ORF Transcript_62583/g.167130 Transcript_62583/m.167130 type:complete len:241 (+) Transcript_62583:1361-2083(+)
MPYTPASMSCLMNSLRIAFGFLLVTAPMAPSRKQVPICPWMMSPARTPSLKRTGSLTISVKRLYPAGWPTVQSYPGLSLSTYNTAFGLVSKFQSGSVNLPPSALHFSMILLIAAVQTWRHPFWPATALTSGGETLNSFTLATSSSFRPENVLMAAVWAADSGTRPSSKIAQASSMGRPAWSSSRTTLSRAGFNTCGLSAGGSSSACCSFSLAATRALAMACSAATSVSSTLSSSKHSRRG